MEEERRAVSRWVEACKGREAGVGFYDERNAPLVPHPNALPLLLLLRDSAPLRSCYRDINFMVFMNIYINLHFMPASTPLCE